MLFYGWGSRASLWPLAELKPLFARCLYIRIDMALLLVPLYELNFLVIKLHKIVVREYFLVIFVVCKP